MRYDYRYDKDRELKMVYSGKKAVQIVCVCNERVEVLG